MVTTGALARDGRATRARVAARRVKDSFLINGASYGFGGRTITHTLVQCVQATHLQPRGNRFFSDGEHVPLQGTASQRSAKNRSSDSVSAGTLRGCSPEESR